MPSFICSRKQLYMSEFRRPVSGKAWSSGGSGRGDGGGGGGSSYGRPRYGGSGGGGGGRFGRPQMDPSAQLRFKKTIKIDPDVRKKLEEMNFSEKTASVLREKGFLDMTPVQSQSYDYVYSGSDVVARSRTGTGKTFAFGLPLIEKLVAERQNERRGEGLPLVLVLEPTRELALQVAQELASVCGPHRMRVQAIFGGASYSVQEKAIRNGVHFLVGTPGRILDHLSRGTLDLSSVRHVVLDEGDTMLEMGFQKAVESIILNVKSPGQAARKIAADSLRSDDDFGETWGRGRRSDDEDEDDEDDDLLDEVGTLT